MSLTRSVPFSIFLLAAGLAAGLPAGGPAGAQGASQCGGPPSATRMYVNVERVRSSTGLIAITVYGDSPKKFLAKRGALYVVRVPAKAGTTRVCVHLPAPGVYGLGAYHDADGDRGFDRSGIGLPAEAYGFSNNPPVIFGLPSFSSVRIRIARTNAWTNIRLKYP